MSVRHRTFGQKIGMGLAAVAMLTVMIGIVSVVALRSVVVGKDRVIAVHAANLSETHELVAQVTDSVSSVRGFLLTRDDRFMVNLNAAHAAVVASFAHLRQTLTDDTGRKALAVLEGDDADYMAISNKVIGLRNSETSLELVTAQFEKEVLPIRQRMRVHMQTFRAHEEEVLEREKKAATDLAGNAVLVVAILAAIAVLAAIILALVLTRTLASQIGAAIQHVRSSSAELQAAANQQATSSREQATAMSEIATTITELLVTSRQIAESAQRVSGIASDTAKAAGGGDDAVQRGQEAVASIRRQVDLVVGHMVDLGRKSQQVGSIVDIINELADQTNILSINASIEAAGAGETGRRFAVVADEIRKLADRVAGSTREIRSLVDEIRSSVNTTVMATEGSSKAVDAGVRQFGDVAALFSRIGGQVQTTTEASREIELSTKQQATAVEQVNLAIANIAQAARETEAGSSQTVQTATQLAGLSGELARLVDVRAAA